jgi:hypothetical protein
VEGRPVLSLRPIKAFEDVRKVVSRDSNPIVGDRDCHMVV